MQPQPIRNLSLAVPVPMDRLLNRDIARGLGTRSIEQLFEWRSAHIPLPTRDLGTLLIPFHIALELLDKVLFPQQDLGSYTLPDRRPGDPFSDEPPVLTGSLLSLFAKLTEHPLHSQPRRTRGKVCRSPIAAPFPLLDFLDSLGPDRIEHHVATDFLQVALFLDQNGFVPSLEQMTHRSVPPVVALSVGAVELAHALGEIRLGGFDDQVIVVVHQTVGVTEPVKAPDDVPQALQEGVAIGIVLEDVVPRIASGRHMIDRPVKLQPKRTRHTLCRYHTDETLFKIQDLTPVFRFLSGWVIPLSHMPSAIL